MPRACCTADSKLELIRQPLVKRDASNDPQAEPMEDSILDLVLKKYASDDGRIGREKILNAVKAFKSYIAQELTYKDLFSKCKSRSRSCISLLLGSLL